MHKLIFEERAQAAGFNFPRFFREEKAQGDWSSVYLLIVFAIAALLLISLVKPMYRSTQPLVKKTLAQAG